MKISLAILLLCSTARCLTISDYVDAIERAENDARGLYGIRVKGITTHDAAYRECFAIIYKARLSFRNSGYVDFVDYLASQYAPVGAKNDPKNLNVNWPRNVRWHLTHPEKK